MFEKLGLQLYTIRDFMKTEEDVKRSFEKLKALGYDEVQTAGCWFSYETFGKLARDAGLDIIGTHEDFEKMKHDLPQSIADHKALNTRNMGIGCLPMTSEEEIRGSIATINDIARAVAKEGFKLTYHNHSHEFVKYHGVTGFDMLLDGFDKAYVSFVLDTYWAQHVGIDIRDLMERMSGRIDILHLKDMAANRNNPFITECGNGNINWKGIIPLAEKIGVKYYVVEQDTCPGDPFESVKQSSEYFHRYFMN